MFGRLATITSRVVVNNSVKTFMPARGLITLKPLKYPIEDGVLPLLTPKALATHYNKIHLAGCKTANDLLMGKSYDLVDPLSVLRNSRDEAEEALLYHALGNVFNHNLFFESIIPGGSPMSEVMKTLIEKNYGSVEELKRRFIRNAMSVYSSGWTFLVIREGRLDIMNTKEGATALAEEHVFPILCIDVWEHAYFQDFETRKSDYIQTFWNVIDWKAAEERLATMRPDVW
eukprot:TRINITY_DN26647_c0_g1_i1.p1 TRINITY_DN26647_c0_g1~~TRINITY_DN26647_c0_g1_i1.p1  ORF type:complete len:230 (-),score=51.34 TRINITY_DN26647_c0_g1_i1:3-692(-)